MQGCALKSSKGNPLCIKGCSRAAQCAQRVDVGEMTVTAVVTKATPTHATETKACEWEEPKHCLFLLCPWFYFPQPLMVPKGSGLWTPASEGWIGWDVRKPLSGEFLAQGERRGSFFGPWGCIKYHSMGEGVELRGLPWCTANPWCPPAFFPPHLPVSQPSSSWFSMAVDSTPLRLFIDFRHICIVDKKCQVPKELYFVTWHSCCCH